MAHVKQLTFFKILSQKIYEYKDSLDVLEIGSYDVNGAIRQVFKSSQCVGVDLIEGKNLYFIGVKIGIEISLIKFIEIRKDYFYFKVYQKNRIICL